MNRSLGLFSALISTLFSAQAAEIKVSMKKLTAYHSDECTGIQKIELRLAKDANYALRMEKTIKDLEGYIKKFNTKTAIAPLWFDYLYNEHEELSLLEKAYIYQKVQSLSIAQPIARRLSKQHIPIYLDLTRIRSESHPVRSYAQQIQHELTQVQPVEINEIPTSTECKSTPVKAEETDSKQ